MPGVRPALRAGGLLEQELALLIEAAVLALGDDDPPRVDALVLVRHAEADVVHAAGDAGPVPAGLAAIPRERPLAVAEPCHPLDRGDDLPALGGLEDADRDRVAGPLAERDPQAPAHALDAD